MGGLFGIVSKGNCFEGLWFATDYHSHLGSESAGLAILGKKLYEPVSRPIRGRQFKGVFEDIFHEMKKENPFAGIGVISDLEGDEQPVKIKSRHGDFAVATTGFIKNAKELFFELEETGVHFEKKGFNQSEIVGQIIKRGESVLDGIKNVYKKIEGGVSILVLSEQDGSIYGSGDIFPHTLGSSKKSSSWALATDTTAFSNTDFKIVKHLNYREIVLIDRSGPKTRTTITNKKKMCSFLFSYFGFPTYTMYGINTALEREKCGGSMAERDDVIVDIVFPVESSGEQYATGYVKRKIELLNDEILSLIRTAKKEFIEKGDVNFDLLGSDIEKAFEKVAPLRKVVHKYIDGWTRSYMQAVQNLRKLVAYYKQVANPLLIKDRILLLWDDSVRRGTQLERYVHDKIKPYGPKEIHGRVGSPVQMYSCFYDLWARKAELASSKALVKLLGECPDDISKYLDENSPEYHSMVKQIGETIGLDSIKFITLNEVIRAIVEQPGNEGVTVDDLCTYCWNGVKP